MDKATRDRVGKMLQFIGRAHDSREKGIASLIGVSQSTVSRWMSGQCVPDSKHMSKIATAFYEACTHIRALSPVPANLQYLCSFAPTYGSDRRGEAELALQESVVSIMDTPARGDNSISLDFHIRAAPLKGGARAHCFVDNRDSPAMFVVLVDTSLSRQDQYIVAFEEAYAHVMNRLIDRARGIDHPDPFIG